jgi:hypothetical protein
MGCNATRDRPDKKNRTQMAVKSAAFAENAEKKIEKLAETLEVLVSELLKLI